MALTLRVDVDKPFGNHTLFRKIASKFFEDTGIIPPRLGYLSHLEDFLYILEKQGVKAVFYFRICTLPTEVIIQRLQKFGHQIGWHVENTSNFKTFSDELRRFQELTGIIPHSFSKHGSGVRKLGRYHYPHYEEEKYLEWSKEVRVPFLFGNGMAQEELKNPNNFYPDVFWLERNYRSSELDSLEKVIILAKGQTVPILTHPENVIRDKNCLEDLEKLIALSKSHNVPWILL